MIPSTPALSCVATASGGHSTRVYRNGGEYVLVAANRIQEIYYSTLSIVCKDMAMPGYLDGVLCITPVV